MARVIAMLFVCLVACAKSHLAVDGSTDGPADPGVAQLTCTPAGSATAVAVTESAVDCTALAGPAPPGRSRIFFLLTDLGSVPAALPVQSMPARETALLAICDGPTSCRTAVSGTVTAHLTGPMARIVLGWSVTLEDGSADSGNAQIAVFCRGMGC